MTLADLVSAQNLRIELLESNKFDDQEIS